jgi:hypothetical protein
MLNRAAAAGAALLVLLTFVGSAGRWPWDHDEVHSLAEIGQVPADRFPGPAGQLERMHRLVPVWTFLQNAALTVLPANETGTRILPAFCGAFIVLLAAVAGGRSRGLWFGWSLGVLLATSQPLIWLSQQNRFYSLALFFLVIALVFTWRTDGRLFNDIVVMACAGAAVLSHNLTLVMFGLAAVGTTAAWLVGSAAISAARRSVAAAATGTAIYFLYLRPILAGWVSGGTGGTSPIVSFVAQAGIVPIALAGVGAVIALRDRRLHAWLALLCLSLSFVVLAPFVFGAWNPRYGLFFMVPVWLLAAAGVEVIALSLVSNWHRAVWLGVVVLMGLPKFASHFIDGSRHDFRTAASIVASTIGPDQAVVSNWPATLQYYLEPLAAERPSYWSPGEPLPDGDVVVVLASNGWEPVLRSAGRNVDVIGEVGRRRLDEQSHLIRIYRVHRE